MLEVNENVKELLRKDNVKKNLRIHFPNGERADIVNSNIVHESLSFTESICSQDSLKFGLCEAPVLEFQTAEVESIKGMEIEASLEVDVTDSEPVTEMIPVVDGRLTMQFCYVGNVEISYPIGNGVATLCENTETSEQYSAIAVPGGIGKTRINIMAPTGTKISLTATFYNAQGVTEMEVTYAGSYIESSKDVAFPFSSVPLGRFIVDECPKESNRFEIRKITAYGYSFSHLNTFNSMEKAKRRVSCKNNVVYKMDAEKYFYSNVIGEYIIPSAIYHYIDTLEDWNAGFGNTFSTKNKTFLFKNETSESELYYLDYDSTYSLETLRQEIEALCDANIPSKKVEIMNSFDFYANSLFWPHVSYSGYNQWGSVGYLQGQKYLYPYASSGLDYATYERRLTIPCELTLKNPDTSEILATFSLRDSVKMQYVVFQTEDNHVREPLWLEIPRKRNKERGCYSVFENTHFPIDVAEGLMELKGLFARYGRSGTMELVSLDSGFGLFPSETLYPSEELYPQEAGGGVYFGSEYKSIVYEEEALLPYGKIIAPYFNEDEEACLLEYQIPKATNYGNEVLVSEKDLSSIGDFIQFQHPTALITDATEARFECPYPIASAYVGYLSPGGEVYTSDIPLEGNPTSFVVNDNTTGIALDSIVEIGVTLMSQTEYTGSAYLYKYDLEQIYYNEDECIVYSLEDNYILQNCQITENELKRHLKEMENKIKHITYVPAEIDMKGLPYLESGDVIQIDSADAKLQTIILRRTMTGIQALMDSIESKE